jgi:threonine dehydrogenase-like Zn-dependent dehydrogenase
MRALLLDGALRRRDDIAAPAPAADEALVRVLRAGICNTDLELARGYMGFRGIPGHEFVGRVEAAPDPALAGRRVVGEINAACGACLQCRRGFQTHCERRTVLGILGRDGSHAEFLVLPARNLHVVPDEITDDEAVFVEPLAAAFEVLQQVLLPADGRCAVLGDGKLGLLVVQVLRSAGLDVLLVGKHAAKLRLAEAWGARTALADGGLGEPFGLVVECTGSPAGFGRAVTLTRPRGTLVLKSTYAGRANVDLAPIVVNEISVVGSRCGPFPAALEALAGGRVQVGPLISARFSLAHAKEAYTRAGQPGTLKVLLRP